MAELKSDRSSNGGAAKRLVMAAGSYWGSYINVGSHHYTKQFLKHGWRAAYLSDQISPLHLIRWRSRAFTADKFRIWRAGGTYDCDGRLWAYNHLTLLPIFNAPFLRSEFVAGHSLRASFPSLIKKVAAEGFMEPDLLWIDHEHFADLLDDLRPAASIYRITDDPALFPETYTRPVLDRVDRLLRDADVVIPCAVGLYEEVLKKRTENVFYVPNGADYDHFNQPDTAVPPEYVRIPRPRVVYTGSIEQWGFDPAMVAAAARQNPEVQFVVIGPIRTALDPLPELANVHLLGPRRYQSLPQYVVHADAAMIPFRRTPALEVLNSNKLYQYLAAGLPVACTEFTELLRLKMPITLTRSSSEFADAIGEILANPGDAETRRAFARANSWDERFGRVKRALGLD